MSNSGDLDGRVAIVTGASYGLGRAITEELARRGARIMLTDILADRIEATTRELATSGWHVDHTLLDVTQRPSVKSAIHRTIERFGCLDIFVNNAGWSRVMKPLRELTAEDWDTYMDINVRGNLFCIQEAAEAMIARGQGGRIVSIASTAATKHYKRAAAYCTSKSAIPMLVKAAALELGEFGITVNCVAPGFIETDMTAGLPDEQQKALLSQIPLGHLGKPGDIAHAVAFLASPEAGYVTGQELHVNGGMYMS